MTEAEFREFLLQNSHNWPSEKIEEMISESSAEHFLNQAAKRGENMSEERANAAAALVRKEIATSIAMHRTGVASKEEVLNHQIEKLPDNFPL